ncbi:uncharacterized protein EV420DRAFT_1141726 [Desarmillaria tabescens]|uniref:F-box domain-containing protein n=1 Tax=Armillaria tabescens TaxID=1929756 RepID=A0AA39TQD2_ARMTA|nr:uncharacterized protein EV420DRAFT_1141726 [Desarmillaria tabescens]KAK0462853.1 hypothetical protein EV420DRAFT_1141726 [Desarmillaria tabescens]
MALLSASSGFPLPQELTNMIIDELEEDFSSLLACSLTCRSFLSPSRRRIFSGVAFDNAADIRGFYAICSESPEISFCVKRLYLQDFSGWIITEDDLLTSIVKGLVNLGTLSLQNMSFHNLSKEVKLCSYRLKLLVLDDIAVDDIQEFCSFLRGCRQLHTLSICGNLIFTGGQSDTSLHEDDDDPSPVSSLRNLIITCTPGSRRLLNTILAWPTPPVRIDGLEHLAIHMQFDGDPYDHLSVENPSLLKRIVDLNRDNDKLVRVSALFMQACVDGRTPPPFDLPVSHLRAISMDLGDFPDILEVNPLPILEWWTNALRPSRNVPTRLESLRIQLYLDDKSTQCCSAAGREAWANLDSVLGDEGHPLRRLAICLIGGEDSPLGEISEILDVTENVIRESMPRLVQKGALSFSKDFGDRKMSGVLSTKSNLWRDVL